jgi:hypothetical protein
MIPIGEIKDIGGTWQVRATIITNASQQIDILAYAKVERNQDLYPQTLGYYIADFNAYKVN